MLDPRLNLFPRCAVESADDIYMEDLSRRLRRMKGFGDLTPEEAEAAFDRAPSIPLSEERIQEILNRVFEPPDPNNF